MNKLAILIISSTLTMTTLHAQEKIVRLKVIETSDVHGMFFPTNYTTGKDVKGSMARVSKYVKRARKEYGSNLIVLENGDILQGQPTNYYWNFINTKDENIASKVVNYIGYDAQAFGNHDIETGHACYDKWIKELHCPVLGANVINANTGEPYTKPYIIEEKDGIRVAILGMLTPAIPNWLEENIWSGLRFDDIVSSSKHWIKVLKEEEKADVVIGLFHTGREGGITTDKYCENEAQAVAEQVPGFDVIMYGHDHTPYLNYVKDSLNENTTVLINPANNARTLANTEIKLTLKNGKIEDKYINAELVNLDDISIDEDYMDYFDNDIKKLKKFTSQPIGYLDNTIYTRDGYFGSSAFIDLIHNLQLSITGADISFNAPLSFDAILPQGELTMADMFNLYKYENKLCVLEMMGKEIKDYLEYSYFLWTNAMASTEDHIMLIAPTKSNAERQGFANPYFNFDSAAGIIYEVDVRKPYGQKIKIIKMANGQKFSEDKIYKVAMNSYRANGGGELLTKGAHISKENIPTRLVWTSDHDQRYYLTEEIKKLGHIAPKANNNWKFVPEKFVKEAITKDRKLLFNE